MKKIILFMASALFCASCNSSDNVYKKTIVNYLTGKNCWYHFNYLRFSFTLSLLFLKNPYKNGFYLRLSIKKCNIALVF